MHIVYIVEIVQSQNGLPHVHAKCSASPGKSQVSLNHWYGMQLKESIYMACIFKVNGFILYCNGVKNNLTCYLLHDSRASWLEEPCMISGGQVKDVIGFKRVNMQIRLQTWVWTHVKHAGWTFSKMDQKKG